MTSEAVRRRRRRPGAAVFAAALILFLVAGWFITVDRQFLMGDALSRVQSAQSVIFSRDPHVAAIGFVFTPLTALIQLPTVALAHAFTWITADAVSGVVMSAVFMAGAVYHVWGVGRDRRLPTVCTVALTILFAVHPMIVFYGGNGMSEAPFLFFLCWAVRRLIRWVDSDDVHDLVTAGICLGLAYLTRYDAVAATAAAAAVVGVVSLQRRSPLRPLRWCISRVVVDMALVVAPAVVAFVAWAATSWLITGNALAQFTSEYGNSAIVSQAGGTPGDLLQRIAFVVVDAFLLFPALLVGVVVIGARRITLGRAAPIGVPVAVFGAVLVFQGASYVTGATFGFLRFYIAAVPLGVVVAMLALSARSPVPARRPGRRVRPAEIRRPTARSQVIVATIVIAATAVSLPSAWGLMASQRYAPQEAALRATVLDDATATGVRVDKDRRVAQSFSTERQIAEWLDAQRLPSGSVLVDTLYGFAILARTTDPRRFVIPSDQDFTQILNDPARFGIRYILAVPRSGRGVTDAVNQRYPTLYGDGARIASLDLEFPNVADDLPTWRVYRVTPD
ncbi:glycosyltransferase family 39 protein [Williamsia serinedens]|uniref:Dolichyl-phosphate-mannose-protein mannosyltransferase n=1 Tax=Williamsia serinedens TaxID=391736 RepID=A0ABT1H3Z6_9NOCA|nr:glycosyltransferase family 39 protein [Williamsia serinedens]MCP2161906.1 Dolichyl-phosphate-mannose-protein mannosyltransferase [Williamsia serinedens]